MVQETADEGSLTRAGPRWMHGYLPREFSTAERFRLRTYVLRQGFGIVKRFLAQSTQRIKARQQSADPEWDRIAVAREDLRTLSMKSLQTFHVLLISLMAEPR